MTTDSDARAVQEDKIEQLERQISELTDIMRRNYDKDSDDEKDSATKKNDEKIEKLKKQIDELISEKEQLKKHNEHLKELIEKNKKDFPEKLKERDEKIKRLSEQVSVLKKEKNVIDETNVRLFSEIDYLQADLKKLNNQIETKDNEVKQVRQMLDNETVDKAERTYAG
ncbi:MAG: hypothetical protein ACLFTR_02695, partial [Candidatus Woesearchaeota archaeon]